ncbi:pre-mRNA-processing factor 39-like [Oppia nitens]|uniref:pre-mRNA-processing factor 39-like n=1 Tax=Oppia nitens TaxID=1686743 RepID=UPI0023DAFBB7|nr:pre-mRNA-processing factor 39-like [Oppia nitens]
MDNLWQLVHQNPQDFMSWTLLLQYCEQTNNMDTISRAYNQFLSHYPYCYAYWIKFAEFGRKLSNERTAFEMLEKAVTVFPNSIDIWIHYLQECIRCHKSDNHIIVLFERALRLCGSDYNSSDLWLLYLHWIQTFRSDPSEVTLIYDRLLQTPIKKLCQHFENFVTFVENNNPIDIINKNEYHLNDNEYNDFINNSKTNCIDIIQFKRSSELSFNVNHLKVRLSYII